MLRTSSANLFSLFPTLKKRANSPQHKVFLFHSKLERLNIGGAHERNNRRQQENSKRHAKESISLPFNGIAVITAAEGGMNLALMVNGKEVGRAQCKSNV
jgi:hypothetical protein